MWRRALFAATAAAIAKGTVASESPSRQDILWLDRITYGPTTATVGQYLKLGRRRFLVEQLHPGNFRLPQPVADEIGALEISHEDGAGLLTYLAMLQYLDNAQNANGHINESYARELLELHTLQRVFPGSTPVDLQLV
jgi:Protein of unknown function (DUF1800)